MLSSLSLSTVREDDGKNRCNFSASSNVRTRRRSWFSFVAGILQQKDVKVFITFESRGIIFVFNHELHR
jgi:hypothetical protein